MPGSLLDMIEAFRYCNELAMKIIQACKHEGNTRCLEQQKILMLAPGSFQGKEVIFFLYFMRFKYFKKLQPLSPIKETLEKNFHD